MNMKATSVIDLDNLQNTQRLALERVAACASAWVLDGGGDELIVLPLDCPPIPGEQGDDGVRALAAIDALRALVATYDAAQEG